MTTNRYINQFQDRFEKIIGAPPLRWQERLFQRFLDGAMPPAVDLPTGLGKTATMAIWYLSLEAGAALPRRLVYVVDRRAVVDQATDEAENIREKLDRNLRISTLRGQHVDNRDWLDDPASRAIVVGTVDMIGSRLLFNGYGVSPKSRSYQAGLLGTDTLVLLDEAHLCAPFEALLATIEQDKSLHPKESLPRGAGRFRLLPLSATGRQKHAAFSLVTEDHADPIVARRIGAAKRLAVFDLDGDKLEDALTDRAKDLAAGGGRIAVYCDSRIVAAKIETELRKAWPGRVALLVGARRVRERETLAKQLEELGFLAGTKTSTNAPAFLVATAAGEVGIDVDADHMVCDLVPAERMIQRLGRVNRRGTARTPALVDVLVSPPKPKADDDEKARHAAVRKALAALPLGDDGRHDASPAAVAALRDTQPELIAAATTPAPLHPALTRALVDAWALTSLPDDMAHAGRPEIDPWLRGWEKEPEPQTRVVWRTHLPLDTIGRPLTTSDVAAFLEAAPPQASELLETETWAVADWLIRLRVDRKLPIVGFILPAAGPLHTVLTPSDLTRDNADRLERRLAGATVIVDARISGLGDSGLLDHQCDAQPPTIDNETIEWLPSPADAPPVVRFRVHRVVGERDKPEKGWRERERLEVGERPDGLREWLIVDKWRDDAATEYDRSTSRPQMLNDHHDWTESRARAIAAALDLPHDLTEMLAIAARRHDMGKRQARWQQAFSAPRDGVYAKTRGPFHRKRLGGYRHEFGSLPLVEEDPDFPKLSPDLQDLALHLVAAHHGGARPFISTQGCEDVPPSALAERATAVALRFARLQRRWGPWGLAWWEALLRAADQQASRENDRQGDD